MSFFKPQKDLTDNTPPFEQAQSGNRKVIMMLFDALREDFVEFDPDTYTYIDTESSDAYKGQKVKLFNKLKQENPENVVLLPCRAEFPTITKVRVKALLSGSLSTFFSISDEFMDSQVMEDNILWQLKHKKSNKGDSNNIVFYGDHMWDFLYGQWFDRSIGIPVYDVSDLDSLDEESKLNIYKELDDGSDFSLMLIHLIGLDSAGHTFSSLHNEIERKILDTEKIIEQIVEKMDDQTTLLVFGDHGMTPDGNHGGLTELEIRSALFAYQKTPFPMYKHYNKSALNGSF